MLSGHRPVPFWEGQLVVRIADGELLRVTEVDLRRGRCRLEDGGWARPGEIESLLRASYRWELERGRREEARREAVERGDFAAAFPRLAARRRARRGRALVVAAALGWLVALGEAALLASWSLGLG